MKKRGAVRAYLRVQRSSRPVSLNLLYALEGALHHRHWQDVVKQRREALLLELEAVKELEAKP